MPTFFIQTIQTEQNSSNIQYKPSKEIKYYLKCRTSHPPTYFFNK